GTAGRAAAGPLAVTILAAALVATGETLGWRGVDLPAQLHRVQMFRAHGFALWDDRWYGGHWALGYSVIFPALAAVAGVASVAVVSAAVASLAFDRLAVPHFGSAGRGAAVAFAVGTVVQSSIGQLPFLAGEALGLCACWAASRNRWVTAAALGAACSLVSPLPGAFLMVAMAGWALAQLVPRADLTQLAHLAPLAHRAPLTRSADRSRRAQAARAGSVIAAAGVPIGAAAILFPGPGPMPYPVIDYAWEMAIAAGLWLAAGASQRAVRAGLLVWAAAATFAVAVPSPLGGNVGRVEDVLALPLAVAFLWRRRRLLLGLAAVPLVLSQWSPAWGAIATNAAQPSTHRAYFAPLVSALLRVSAGGPAGRVEVVPTRYHWESLYVAQVMPLARGWERQLDEADNPVFYGGARALDAASYRSWLVGNGVRFVALPDAPLDFSGVAEARVVRTGVPGVDLVWQSAAWSLYEVEGSGGIVGAPARLVSEDGPRLVLSTPAAGPVLVRVRYTPGWRVVQGAGCVAKAPGSWIRVDAAGPGLVTLRLSLLGPGATPCGGPPRSPTAPRRPAGVVSSTARG
ncbi:MAG: hypothetical protein ACRDWW_00890, partial [Acidimicrobiales bacterium]